MTESPPKRLLNDAQFAVLFLVLFLVAPHIAWNIIWHPVIPPYEFIQNILGWGLMLGWAGLGLYGMFTGRFKDVPTGLGCLCVLICGTLAGAMLMMGLMATVFSKPRYCEPAEPNIYICDNGDSVYEPHAYRVQPNGVFLEYIGVVTPTPHP